jgi:hypothetical protein
MKHFASILRALQAAIAARAARDRSLTVLLVSLWGRVARMCSRLERLIRLWRAGRLPKPRAPRVRVAAPRDANIRIRFPRAPAWLVRKLGYEVAAFGGQLAHALTDAEFAAFLAACPQAGRVLRPLLGMLSGDALPVVVRRVRPVVVAAVSDAARAGVVVSAECQFLRM